MEPIKLEELIPACEGICRRIVRSEVERRFLTFEDGEDLMQTARLAVWEAARKHDPSRGAKITTFVWILVRDRVKSAASRVRRHCGMPEGADGWVMEPGMEDEMPATVEKAELLEKLHALLGELVEGERKPIELLIEGIRLETIAQEMGLQGRNLRGMAFARIKKTVQKMKATWDGQSVEQPVEADKVEAGIEY